MWNLVLTAGLLATIAIGTSGYEMYDSNSAICCSGEVLPFPEETDGSYGCCYSEDYKTSVMYNYQTQRCCSGNVLEVPDEDNYYDCCAGELYTTETHTCCQDTLFEYNGDTDMQCCGNVLYDVSKEICCNFWDEQNNDASKAWEIEEGKVQCCRSEAYNPEDSICCGGEVQPRPENFESSANVECCGEIPYDTTKQVCCSDYELVDGHWQFRSEQLVVIEGNKTSCCGLQLYDYHEEVCCTEDDSVIPKPEGVDHDSWMECCGGEVLTDYSTQTCSDGQIVDRDSSDIRECGDQRFNYWNQSCCADKYVYDDDSDMRCCYYAGELYDYNTQLCCGSEVEEKSEEDIEAGRDSCCYKDE